MSAIYAVFSFAVFTMAALPLGSMSAIAAPLKVETVTLVTSTGTYDFRVEIADSRNSRTQGLMFRRSMGKREGMLFFYDEEQPISMWMRNTYIPLDMIFIRQDGRVHRIEADTEPFSERIIASGDRVLSVLEVNAGTAADIGLKPGDEVRHARFKPAIKK